MVGYADAGHERGAFGAAETGFPQVTMPAGRPAPGVTDRPVVLVADDDPAIADLVADLLAEEGYAVRRAYDGAAALAEAERARPDLVVADVAMPRLGGVGLARELRRRGHHAPVVLMSAVHAAPDLPGAAFLPKPFDLDHVLAAVERALRGAA